MPKKPPKKRVPKKAAKKAPKQAPKKRKKASDVIPDIMEKYSLTNEDLLYILAVVSKEDYDTIKELINEKVDEFKGDITIPAAAFLIGNKLKIDVRHFNKLADSFGSDVFSINPDGQLIDPESWKNLDNDVKINGMQPPTHPVQFELHYDPALGFDVLNEPVKKKPAKKKGKPKLSAKLKKESKKKPVINQEPPIQPPVNEFERTITSYIDDDGDTVIEEDITIKKKAPAKKAAKKAPKKAPKKKAPKRKAPAKAAPMGSKTIGLKRAFIVLINAEEGTGKTVAALTFPRPFVLAMEDKIIDTIDYPPEVVPFVKDFVEGKDYAIGIVYDEDGVEDLVKTNENITYWIDWFKTEGYKDHDSFIIDVGKGMWDAAHGAVAQKKKRALGKVEYIPITKKEKKRLIGLKNWCRVHGKNLIIISHMTGKYKDIDEFTTIMIGEIPDVKYWIREFVAWRIDLLTPEESGIPERFIAYFRKAPGSQYFRIDITGKKLYDIISDPDKLTEAKEEYRKMTRKLELDAKKKLKEMKKKR